MSRKKAKKLSEELWIARYLKPVSLLCTILVVALHNTCPANANYAPNSDSSAAREGFSAGVWPSAGGSHADWTRDHRVPASNQAEFGRANQALSELSNLEHHQASSKDGTSIVQVRRRSTSGAPAELPDGKTMVVVSSKSGRFNQVLPLDDLIVSPAASQRRSDPTEPSPLHLSSDNHDERYEPTNSYWPSADGASLPQETSANQLDAGELPVDAGETKYRLSYSRNQGDLDLTAVNSANDGPLSAAPNAETPEQNEVEQEISADQMPDSIESLMRSGGESLDDESDPKDQSASEQVQGQGQALDGSTSTGPDESGDEEDEGDDAGSPVEPLVPASLPVGQQLHEHPPLAQQESGLIQQPLGSLIHSSQDLQTAAGHYHGKKKKKIKKKKVKIVIKKKKKKKKKVKKVKIIKIKKKKKKKKVMKKKKKSKKMHHDHGKYYMYAKVPKKKSWEFGFKKGNKKHWIERHEKGHKNKFKTKVKWYDKKSKGKGLHIWDYNHHDKKKKKKHYA